MELAVDELVSDELDDSDDELASLELEDDSDDELASLEDELDEMDELELEVSLEEDDELSDDEDDDVPNTALNCSSVTQVSPTQILFALTVPFSNDIPNIVLNLSKIHENKLSVPVPLDTATLACKSLTFKFNSCTALVSKEVISAYLTPLGVPS